MSAPAPNMTTTGTSASATAGSSQVWGWITFFDELGNFLQQLERQQGRANQQFTEYALERLESTVVNVAYIRDVLRSGVSGISNQQEREVVRLYESGMNDLLLSLQSTSMEWDVYLDRLLAGDQRSATAYRAPASLSHQRGRPKFDISREQLEYLSSMWFTWTEIASLLGVSRMTIYRRRREFGMLQDGREIRGARLHEVIQQMRTDLPDIGEVMMLGRLRSLGFRVTRDRLRDAIRATDPLNTALRGLIGPTPRRPYSVPGPNSLWHIDGHHKLVRWGFVTHGGIDGYSRMITFLKCSSNNKAVTVYESFLDAVRRLGLPSRVRSDQGRENILVAQHMLEHRGMERRSMITGSSTHNQRIERLWRDLHRCVTQLFYRLFYHLESYDLLDQTNDLHLFALQYVYLPRINNAVTSFLETWNHHPIRTERNRSPHQLFIHGSLQLQRSGLAAVDFFETVHDHYGVEEEGIVSNDEGGAEIPQSSLELTQTHQAELQQQVDPTAQSNCYGIDLYQQTLQFVFQVVANNPQVYGQLV